MNLSDLLCAAHIETWVRLYEAEQFANNQVRMHRWIQENYEHVLAQQDASETAELERQWSLP